MAHLLQYRQERGVRVRDLYRPALLVGVLSLLLLAPASLLAADLDLLPEWNLSGSNTLRYDKFNSSGDQNGSPYPFTGAQTYDEFSLSFDRNFSPYNRVSGQVGGLFNDSSYRSSFFGVVPETLYLKQENGGFSVPYRFEAGDYYSYLSFRTIQRTLKGVQLELQPTFGDSHHSIEIFSGAGSPSWRSFQVRDDWTNGASWMVNHPLLGVMSINFVMNHQQGDPGQGLAGKKQYVYSLAWEKSGEFLGENFTIEGELGRFTGDHQDTFFIGDGLRRQGNGFFAQLTGSPKALSALGYRMRYEAYEQDYIPAGAAVESDRRSEEGHLSWTFDSGLVMRARLQNFHTGWQTDNPVDTNTYGGNISGPLLSDLTESLSISLDAFGQDMESRDLAINTMTKSVNVSLSKGVGDQVALRGTFYYLNVDDKTFFGSGASITRQVEATMDFKVDAYGVTGTFSPGVLLRRVDAVGIRDLDINPTVSLNLSKDQHQLSLSYTALDQKRALNDLGLATRTAAGSYRYTMDQFSFGIDADWYERNPDSTFFRRTDAWRIGAFITYSFDKPARALPVQVVREAAEIELVTSRFAVDITFLKPGMGLDEAMSHLRKSGLGKPAKQAGLLVWFRRIVKEMGQNQRLVVDVSDAAVQRSSVVIEFDEVGDVGGIRSTFEVARKLMLQKYGKPDAFFDQGEFGSELASDLASGRFIRVMEWRQQGGVLRFGIPRRLGGKIRMELQFARNFPPLRDPLWGMRRVQ